jgi:ketosteroid isomerase-like protein
MRPARILLSTAPLVLAACAIPPRTPDQPPAPAVSVHATAPTTSVVVEPASCPPPAPAPSAEEQNPEAARRAVEQAMQAYAAAVHNGPPRAVAARFTAEGELQLPDLAALHGRKAIMDFLTPLSETSEISSVKMRTELLDVRGTSASQWGFYDQDAGERGKPPAHFHGRYAALWRLEADGVWRLERLMMQPLATVQ